MKLIISLLDILLELPSSFIQETLLNNSCGLNSGLDAKGKIHESHPNILLVSLILAVGNGKPKSKWL